jgi:three-Cys-motif partner protein
MAELEPRPVQTKVKHEILEEYLMQWGYIVTGGLIGTYAKARNDGRTLRTRFVYVDCFSYRGEYAPENGEPAYGSPLIGIRSFQRLSEHFFARNGTMPETYFILVEEERNNYRILLETLARFGVGDRVRESPSLTTLNPGEIALFNSDYTRLIDQILDFTDRDYIWSFYLLDPYGPKGLQFDIVRRIVEQEYSDVVINLMYQDLHKKTGIVVKEELSPEEYLLLQHWDAVYGGDLWHEIAERYYRDEISKEEMERELVELYKKILLTADKSLAVKRIPLKFEDKERTMFYLFLTTHDGTGAAKMNEILDGAHITQYDYRQYVRKEKLGQMTMFDIGVADPSRPQDPKHDIDDIADKIYELCKGSQLEFRQVLARLADMPYHLDNVKKAMTQLKKSKKCSYDELKNKNLIRFS